MGTQGIIGGSWGVLVYVILNRKARRMLNTEVQSTACIYKPYEGSSEILLPRQTLLDAYENTHMAP